MTATQSTTAAIAEQADNTTILVVEDDHSIADLYSKWLADMHTVRTAYTGEEALSKLDDTVDVVLLDRRMPNMPGDEVLRTINQRGLDPQVIMVTAVKPDFDIIELGFDEYVIKPVDRADLVQKVDQAIARTRYESLLQEYYQLSDRRDTLEAIQDQSVLENDEEYISICDRLEEVITTIDALLDRFEDSHFTSAIERTQTIAALTESEQRYRSMTEDVLDTSRVGTIIVDGDGRVEWANSTVEQYFDVSRTALLNKDYPTAVTEFLAPAVDKDDDFSTRLTEAFEANETVEEFECQLSPNDTTGTRWLKHWSKPIETGLYAGGRIVHYYDVTAIKRREQALETLHGATRQLIDADRVEGTATIAVETAEKLLDFPSVGLFLRDEANGDLRLSASSDSLTNVVEDPAALGAVDGPIWNAYVEGEPRVASTGLEATPFECELILPLGPHGVFYLGDQAGTTSVDTQLTLAQTLAANSEVALDRTERERVLRRRDQQLKDRNEQLARLNRINTVIRSIGRALVNASSRAEIEQAVCDQLIEIDSYAFVWTGAWDVSTDGLEPRSWAGDDRGYLDQLDLEDDDSSDRPVFSAVATQQPTVIQNLIDEPAHGTWGEEALRRGFQSVVAIPLAYDESVYGVLEVYADRPMAFDAEEQEVLGELGETIGHAINAVKRKDALLAGGGIELEFAVPKGDDFFMRLANEGEGQVELRTLVPESDGSYLAFFTVTGIDSEQVVRIGEESAIIEEIRHVRDQNEAGFYKCTLNDPALVTTIAEHGAVPKAIGADSDGGHIVVDLPHTADVREFAESISATFPDVEMIARRDQVKSNGARTLHERLDECLTDRQREALQAAYFSGYFDWPRERNGEDIAGTLDIAQPTFQQHLRAGERNLFQVLFDEV